MKAPVKVGMDQGVKVPFLYVFLFCRPFQVATCLFSRKLVKAPSLAKLKLMKEYNLVVTLVEQGRFRTLMDELSA